MLIVALVLAVISLAALVTAVVTSNELIAWVCIGLSALGVLLLIADAIRDRNRRPAIAASGRNLSPSDAIRAAETTEVIAPVVDDDYADDDRADDDDEDAEDYEIEADEAGEDAVREDEAVEDYPDEVVYDDPEHDEPSDDEPDYPVAAEEAAIHTITTEDLVRQADSDEEMVSDVEPRIESDVPGSYVLIYPDEPSDTSVDGLADTATDETSDEVADEPSYIVTESPTVSYADASGDDSVIVIYSSETEAGQSEDSEEERGGER